MIIFASDYDETLYQNGVVNERDIEAIARFRGEGHLFMIATGRHLNSIGREIERFNLAVDYTIGNNGSAILDGHKNEFYMADMDRALVREVFDYVVSELSDSFYFFAVNNGYTYGQRVFLRNEHMFDPLDTIGLDEAFESEKICALFGQVLPSADSVAIADLINARFAGRVSAYSNNEFVDVTLPGDNKASAILRVIDSLEMDLRKVYTIGDSHNDIDMIRAYHGFVIRNGQPILLDYGMQVVDNVAQALELVRKDFK